MALGRSLLDRLSQRGAMIGLLCALLGWVVSLHRVSKGLEDWFQDACFAYRGTWATATRIVIVALDADSLRALPKPIAFASEEFARVIRYLIDQGVAGIGLDVIVPEELDGFKGLERGPRELGDLALGEWWRAARRVAEQDGLDLFGRNAQAEVMPGDLEGDGAALTFGGADELGPPLV